MCDNGINDNDGIASFNFKSIEDEIKQFLIPPYTNYDIKYYENEENALAEKYEIENISNYQNQNSPNIKFIWVRVDNKIDNSCYALGRHIKLIVNPYNYDLKLRDEIDTKAQNRVSKLDFDKIFEKDKDTIMDNLAEQFASSYQNKNKDFIYQSILNLESPTFTDEQAEDVSKLIERLEQDDDVNKVFHNMG